MLSQIILILSYPITATMEHTHLGIWNPTLKCQTQGDWFVMWLCLEAAKMALAAAWKKVEAPSLTQWHARLWRALVIERMADIVENSRRGFDYVWAPLDEYLSEGLPLFACGSRLRALHLFHM